MESEKKATKQGRNCIAKLLRITIPNIPYNFGHFSNHACLVELVTWGDKILVYSVNTVTVGRGTLQISKSIL